MRLLEDVLIFDDDMMQRNGVEDIQHAVLHQNINSDCEYIGESGDNVPQMVHEALRRQDMCP